MHFIGTDNYAAMSAVVEHLVTIHGCKTFNYVGGPADNIENCQRKQAFYDVLKKYDIPVEKTHVRDYNFTKDDGGRAFLDFYSEGIAFPDAVVCANDNMAIGYIKMLEKYGYNVPEDTIVTGFDNLFEAQCNIPGITSVGRSREKLGEICAEQILKMISGEIYPHYVYVPFEFSPKESCGCTECLEKYKPIQKKFTDKVFQNEHIRWRMSIIQKKLISCQTAGELKHALYKEMENLSIGKFAILINEEEYIQQFTSETVKTRQNEGFSPQMRIIFDGRISTCEEPPEIFETKQLIPRYLYTDAK